MVRGGGAERDREERDRRGAREERKCYNCGEPGHIGRDCTKPRAERTGGGGGGGAGRNFMPPPLFSCHKGKVKRVAEFGAFVEMDGMGSKWGLVHFSQILEKAGDDKIDVADVLSMDDAVWVKVIGIDVEAQKVSLSMKYVDQATGEDLDPFNVKHVKEKEREEARRAGGGKGNKDFDPFAANKQEEEAYKSHSWGQKAGGGDGAEEHDDAGPKQEKNFGLSGLLAKETRMWQGIELKFTEPPEGRMPTLRWRLYEFKGDEQTNTLHLHRCSCYVFGKDRSLNKFPGFIPTDHPSCSRQHAVIQFRLKEDDDGVGGSRLSVRPYIMDLASTNGVKLNGDRIEDMRYYELKEKDMLKFGNSSREYIVLHDGSLKKGADTP